MTKCFWLLFLIALCFENSFASREIILIGINGNGAPSVSKTFENRLRDLLSANTQLHLTDKIQSKRYQNLTDFSISSSLSTEKLDNLRNFVPVSSLIIWVNIKRYSISPERKYLFWSSLKGKLTIGLNIYHPDRQEFVYCGDIEVVADKSAGFTLFRPVSKTVHVSAINRTEIMEALEYKAVRDCNRIIITVVQNEDSSDDELSRETNVSSKTEIETTKETETPQNTPSGNSSDTGELTINGTKSSQKDKEHEETGQQ